MVVGAGLLGLSFVNPSFAGEEFLDDVDSAAVAVVPCPDATMNTRVDSESVNRANDFQRIVAKVTPEISESQANPTSPKDFFGLGALTTHARFVITHFLSTKIDIVSEQMFLNKARLKGYEVKSAPILRELNMPRCLWSVPQVESHWQQNAVSDSGARSFWQIMPKTYYYLSVENEETKKIMETVAKKLKINLKVHDFRSDTVAGITYLKTLYDKFQSYPLAIAAYNMGPGAVDKLVSQRGHDFFRDIYPALLERKRNCGVEVSCVKAQEQLEYVPKVMSTCRLAERAK